MTPVCYTGFMIDRDSANTVLEYAASFPVVMITGPR